MKAELVLKEYFMEKSRCFHIGQGTCGIEKPPPKSLPIADRAGQNAVILGSWSAHFRDEAGQGLGGLWRQLTNLQNQSQGWDY
jgi:hypothetical protein